MVLFRPSRSPKANANMAPKNAPSYMALSAHEGSLVRKEAYREAARRYSGYIRIIRFRKVLFEICESVRNLLGRCFR